MNNEIAIHFGDERVLVHRAINGEWELCAGTSEEPRQVIAPIGVDLGDGHNYRVQIRIADVDREPISVGGWIDVEIRRVRGGLVEAISAPGYRGDLRGVFASTFRIA